jgi:hypothetical protein
MFKLDGLQLHFVLYAKLRYMVSDNLVQDLKILCHNYSGHPLEGFGAWSVFEIAYESLISLTENDPRLLRYHKEIFRKLKYCKSEQTTIAIDELLREVMGVLSIASVIDGNHQKILDLGSPDQKLLPLRQ